MKPLLSKEEIADLLAPLGKDAAGNPVLTGGREHPPHKKTVRIRVETGRTEMAAENLQHLNVGSLISLDQSADTQVAVYVEDQLIAYGTLVPVDGCQGVKITKIIS
jgi:flagellar motor switch/type III secretory pathway protein FliN